MAGALFSDLQKSPYKDRIVPVLDSVHGGDVLSKLQSQGVPSENIVIWSNNGIEYYYPKDVLGIIYGEGGELAIDGDIVERNGIRYKKAELADKVVAKLNGLIGYENEFREKFIGTVERITGLTNKVRSRERSEPRSEPFVGRARVEGNHG